MNEKKLAIIVLGKPNSGKSRTWYEIFGRTIRTGRKKLRLSGKDLNVFVKNSSFEETGKEINLNVFVRNASFEEYGDEITNFFNSDKLPEIIFCSVQYTKKGIRTINWFQENGYYLYIQWLNPGYTHKREYSDYLNFEETFKKFGEFHKVNGKEKESRVNAIKEFLVKWVVENEQ